MEGCSLASARGKWTLAATVLASGAVFLLTTAVSIALPAIQQYFDATISDLQWIVNAYLLALTAPLLVGGALGDLFGRKRIFSIGLALMSVSAVLAGLAPTVSSLILFQAVLGVASALVVPQSLSVISACFRESERGQAIGLWAGLSGAIAAPGPWLGGWLVQQYSWRAVWFMAAPITILALIFVYFFVLESRNKLSRRIDWVGALLILAGLLGIAYALISGPGAGWTSPRILAPLTGGVLSLVAFVLVEARQREPLVPLRIFRNRFVAGANACTLMLYFALNGVLFFMVLNMQQVQGYSANASGLGLLPPIALITFLSGPAGMLADRIGARLPMILGPALVALGTVWLALSGTGASYVRHYLPGLSLLGIGMALVIAPLTKSALAVEPELAGAASGVNNGIARVAALLAITILGVIIVSTFTLRLGEAVNTPELTLAQRTELLAQSDKLGGIVIPATFDEAARRAARQAINESFIYGFRRAMAVCALLAFLATAFSAAMIPQKGG
ncbi:MAG: MFS transporter [Chloroflexi bacterium]|nr:MFS transporter [Chloroflexota bacterium]